MIVIVDYGMGNLGSIVNMLKRIGVKALVSGNPQEIKDATKLILPGVGAFDTAMARLAEMDLIQLLTQKVVEQQTLTLGVCLGMQLLTERSEEGELPGLGWIEGETVRFHFDDDNSHLKIPHMGWNSTVVQHQDMLLHELEQDSRFYFVHSYHVLCKNKEDILASTNYGYEFSSIVRRGNVMGAQFHPEKSHKFGMKLLANFVEMS